MNMKAIRQLKGLSQEEVAKRVGLSQSCISFIEAGRWFPTANKRRKIDKTLGWPIDWNETLKKGIR
jgi:transcriptional regulator with XRE-family HTH domain